MIGKNIHLGLGKDKWHTQTIERFLALDPVSKTAVKSALSGNIVLQFLGLIKIVKVIKYKSS